MAALALPVTLALGAVAAAASGLVRRVAGAPAPWWGPVAAPWTHLRRAAARRERLTVIEAGGGTAALAGASLAAAAAAGWGPGSAILVYLSLALAAAGGQVAASDPGTRAADGRVAGGRAVAVMAEPVFAVALAAVFLRFEVTSVEAVAGAQRVLGPGVALGPPLAAGALAAAVLALAISGALRLAPTGETPRGGGRPPASAGMVTLCRWSLAGATALVAAAVAAGAGPAGSAADVVAFGGAAVGAAALIGAVDGAFAAAPLRWALLPPAAALAVAAAVLASLGAGG